MADFRTHITSSGLLGAAFGVASHLGYEVPIPTAILAGGLVTIGGVLPDVDSDNAIVLRESLAMVAVITPMMMLHHFREWGWTTETIVLASAIAYLVVRFGFGNILRRITVHRGMWHSIPAAGIAGALVFMLCSCTDMRSRLCKTTAIVLGYIWHLVLDEINSVESTDRGRVRIKRSFGTALKFFGRSPLANLAAYSQLIVLGFIALATTPNPWFKIDARYASHEHEPAASTHVQPSPGYPMHIYGAPGGQPATPYYSPGGPPTYSPPPYVQP